MGPEGFEPPPTGLKGRHAAATPRPRAGHLVPGYSFESRSSPRSSLRLLSESQGGRIRTGGLKPPRACGLARLSHALSVPASSPCGNRTHLSALKGRYPRTDRRTGQRSESGPGGARIHVCGSSGRRYTVSATGPSNEEARLSADTGPWANRRGCVGRGVTGAADRTGSEFAG